MLSRAFDMGAGSETQRDGGGHVATLHAVQVAQTTDFRLCLLPAGGGRRLNERDTRRAEQL